MDARRRRRAVPSLTLLPLRRGARGGRSLLFRRGLRIAFEMRRDMVDVSMDGSLGGRASAAKSYTPGLMAWTVTVEFARAGRALAAALERRRGRVFPVAFGPGGAGQPRYRGSVVLQDMERAWAGGGSATLLGSGTLTRRMR